MDDGSTSEPIVIHTVLKIDRGTLVFLRLGDKYTLSWRHHMDLWGGTYPHWWYTLDKFLDVRVSLDTVYEEQRVMNEFIREYVGEERWALAILANLL